MEPTQSQGPVSWLKEKKTRARMKLGDQSLKLLSYVGRLALLMEVPLVGRLKVLSKGRDLFWGISAIRDLSEVPRWIEEWRSEKKHWTLADHAHLALVRINFLTKTSLKAINLLVYNPYLIRAKAYLSQAALVLVLTMDAKSLFQAARGKKVLSVEKGLGMGDDVLDMVNTSMDLEWLPAHDALYVATGLGSASMSLIKGSIILWQLRCAPSEPGQ